jgi:PAS domain S-box-containing protein
MVSLSVQTIANKKPYAFYLFLAWTVFIIFSLLLTIHNLRKTVLEQAAIEARTHLELNLEYRALISELGGVYASVNAISPNPYLAVSKRDITTKDGDKLTLLNPAYMTRLIFEKIKNKSSLPVINKITSLKIVNPINAPDEWERKTLLAFEKGVKEAREITSINGNSYLRLMRPFLTENSCLKCHGYQGYEGGEVRGAISIAVPIKPYSKLAVRTRNISLITYLLLWFTGCIGLIVFSRFKQKQEQRLIESEWKFRTLSESANDWEYWLSENRQIVYMSPSSEKVTGYGPQEFMNNPDLLINIIPPEDRPLFLSHSENLQDASHEEMEFRIISKSGQVKWLAHTCSPLYMQHKFLGRRINNRDITYRKMSDEALHESYEQIEDLYNNAPCGYHSLDREGKFVRINDTELRWLGYNRDEVVGKMKFSDFITTDSLRTFETNFPIFKTQGWIRDLEFEMIRKDGTILPVLLSASAIKDNNGNYVMSRSTVFDITERKLTEEELRKHRENLEELVEQRTAELRKMADELTRSNKDLKEFAYVVSHDLREPLQVVKGFLRLFEKRYKDKLDEKAEQLIRFTIDGAERMQELIKDLLEYAQVGTKGKKFKSTDCSLILNNAVSNLKVSLEESVGVVTHDTLPTVMADAIQLSSLFQNLVGNAIKFRGSEAPRIHMSAERKGDKWLFSVRDNGIGMNPEFADRIFDVFQRLHSSDEYPGTGIGLAICKKIVEHHGGKIWVESEPGKGATFYFTIPERQAQV